MRTSLSPCVVICLLFVVGVLTTALPPGNAPPIKCGRGMTTTNCAPCSPICNQGPRPCPLFCVQGRSFCVCKANYSLPSGNSTYCIPTKRCPRKRCPTPAAIPQNV